MSTVKDHLQEELEASLVRVSTLTGFLEDMSPEIGALESDHVWVHGGWLCLRDTTHKNLGAKIASILDETATFTTCGQTRTAIFYNLGPFYKVDLDRPNPKCRKVRVLKPAQELEMSICGDIPEGYELIDVTDEEGL